MKATPTTTSSSPQSTWYIVVIEQEVTSIDDTLESLPKATKRKIETELYQQAKGFSTNMYAIEIVTLAHLYLHIKVAPSLTVKS